jgi:hypothetical protein
VLPNAPAVTAPAAAVQLTQDQALAAQGWARVGTDANGNGVYSKPGFAQQYAFMSGTLQPITVSTASPNSSTCASPYVWNGTQCVLPNAAVPAQPAQSTAAPPTNYSQVGTDSAGNTIYANAQGVLYSWTGTGMQIFSGQLATGNSSAAQMQAAIQNALAQGQSSQQAAAAALQQAQTAGVAVTPQLQQQVAAQVDATQTAPVQPIAAGVGSGSSLGNTAAIISIAATVLGLMLATAHPAKQPRVRKRRPRA